MIARIAEHRTSVDHGIATSCTGGGRVATASDRCQSTLKLRMERLALYCPYHRYNNQWKVQSEILRLSESLLIKREKTLRPEAKIGIKPLHNFRVNTNLAARGGCPDGSGIWKTALWHPLGRDRA